MSATFLHRTALDIGKAARKGLRPLPAEEGLASCRASGTIESAVIESPEPFDDLVASWNASLHGGRLELAARVRRSGSWSPWFQLGEASAAFRSPQRQENAFGYVDTDTLRLSRKAQAFQYRVRLTAAGKPATLKLVAVTVSNGEAPEAPPRFRPGPWVRELKLAARSQFEEKTKEKGDICSPTSLSMVLEWWGIKRATLDVAALVRDARTGIYGDWAFNVAAAADLGAEAWVARLGSLEDIQDEIAEGRPVIASITFGPGELSGAPLKQTRGHLVVVIGFTPSGDVIVLDPASPDRRGARRVFGRAQFHRAWRINKRGLVYLVAKPLARPMTVGAASTRLRRRPDVRSELFSDLLCGEKVIPLRARGNWLEVLAAEQPSADSGQWRGYCGWMRAEDLLYRAPVAPDSVVAARQVAMQAGRTVLRLSLGTRLVWLGKSGDRALVRLLDGRCGTAPAAALRRLDVRGRTEGELRSRVLAAAASLLGARYVWGGRSTVSETPGVDCSGLSSLAYRAAGIDIPRDARCQKLRSRSAAPGTLRPADLIFLTRSARSRAITHVMIFEGRDSIIEARQSAGRVVRTTFQERFGAPLRTLRDGAIVSDLSDASSLRRRIYFGSLFSGRQAVQSSS